jgi:hypothetical protein
MLRHLAASSVRTLGRARSYSAEAASVQVSPTPYALSAREPLEPNNPVTP